MDKSQNSKIYHDCWKNHGNQKVGDCQTRQEVISWSLHISVQKNR